MKRWCFFVVLLALVVLLPDLAFASDADSSVISKIVKAFESKSGEWTTVAKKYALILFGLCATLEIAWLGVKAALGQSQIGETFKNFTITLVVCGFFLAVINNYAEWSKAIIHGMMSIAGEMTNIENSSDAAFKAGLQLCGELWALVDDMGPTDIGLILCMVVSLFVVIVCFCLITAQVILIKCESYVAMAAACILVGLGGSSVMRDYAVNVLKYIVSVAFKLMVVQLIIGIAYTFIKESLQPKADFPTCMVAIGVSIVLLALVRALPEVVSGIIQGSHTGGSNSMSMAAVSVGSGLAGAAAGAYYGARNVGLAAQAAKSQGATGLGGMLAGTASNLWNASREAALNKEERAGTIGANLRSRIAEAKLPKVEGKE